MTTVDDIKRAVTEAVEKPLFSRHDLGPSIAAAARGLSAGGFEIGDVTVEDDVVHVDVAIQPHLAAIAPQAVFEDHMVRNMDIPLACRRILEAGPPDVAVVRGLVEVFYARPGNGAGGALHVQLDDGNLEDHFLDEPIDDDDEADALRRVLLAMPHRRRWRVYTGEGPDALEQMEESLEPQET